MKHCATIHGHFSTVKTPQATLNMHSSLIPLTFISPLQSSGTQQCVACSQQDDKHTLYSQCSHVSSTRSQTNSSDPVHSHRLAPSLVQVLATGVPLQSI